MIPKIIASSTANQTAIAHAHAQGGYKLELLSNDNTPLEIWSQLYSNKKPNAISVKDAKSTFQATHVTGERLEHVLNTEKRPSVISSLIQNADLYPTPELLQHPTIEAMLESDNALKSWSNRYGYWIDREFYASKKSEDLSAVFRAYRLCATSVPDEEVLAELLSYDAWGNVYKQRIVSWVLFQRPHLMAQLQGDIPLPVVVQAAGCVSMGVLSAEQQSLLLGLDKDIAAYDREKQEGWSFAWMAAASNPTVKLEVVQQIADLHSQIPDLAVGSVVQSRKSKRNWDVSSFSTETDSDKLGDLIFWAFGWDKIRAHAIAALLQHKELTAAEVNSFASRFVASCGRHQFAGTPLHSVEGVALVKQFVEFYSDVDCVQEMWSAYEETVAEALPQEALVQLGLEELCSYHRNKYAGSNTTSGSGSVRYLTDANVRYLDEQLGDNEQAWKMAFTMWRNLLDKSVKEYADVCLSLSL